jgi:hypothetical protein
MIDYVEVFHVKKYMSDEEKCYKINLLQSRRDEIFIEKNEIKISNPEGVT